MKKTKIYSALFSIILIAVFIYPLITGSMIKNGRSTCTYTFNMQFLGVPAGGAYTACIGGGEPLPISKNQFSAKLDCGQQYSVCVSNGTYKGTLIFTPPCPCSDTTINITMVASTERCACSNP